MIAKIIEWLKAQTGPGAHLCLDSRLIGRGDVFFACAGVKTDGRLYLEQAAQNGAAAIVAERGQHGGADAVSVPLLEVDGLAGMLGALAHEWYGKPSETLSVVAVTGTNGKTTAVQWIAAALNTEDVPCGTVGTLGVTLPDGTNLGGALTTPDVLTMHRSLAAIRDAGAKAAAIEASSIGLDQGRMDQVRIEIAGFTNLTRDHLDYHKSLEAYKAAKFALFSWPGLSHAVINVGDPAGLELAGSVAALEPLTYSLEPADAASIQARDIQTGTYGLIFNLTTQDGVAQIVTRLVGEHNVSNLLLVAGVLQYLGWPLTRIARVLATLRSVEGRLQIIEPEACGDAATTTPMTVVDYAHTPDALERALLALREVASVRGGRLICVFGCGGNRDSGKRPIMGRIAAQLADHVILTNDNPRDEDPVLILNEIMAGMPQAPVVEPDRAQAILSAVWGAKPNDIVLLAGKGHETYQEIQGHRSAFDDREWSRFALTWLRNRGLSTDSRSIAPGQIFLALKGDVFDGHAYLEQVQEAAACAAVVEQRNPALTLPQFALGDTRAALGRIGAAWRRRFSIPAIAVAGSNGKTTTKEMIASILRAWQGAEGALSTAGNFNNDIGVPLTLLRLREKHRAAVFELGMNHPGEIAYLAWMAQPTIALVNNAQREHQEFMHTVEAVARENGGVLTALPPQGVAVFPGDDAYSGLWREMAGARRCLTFGLDAAFDVHAGQIHAEPARTLCQLTTPEGSCALALAVPGLHNLRNALAAAACASAAGVPLDCIKQGLEAFHPVSGRMQPHRFEDGLQLIDDTYNANPDSVRAAIDVLAGLAGARVLVLGDMGEVGEQGPAMHAEVGAYAKERGIGVFLAFGPAARHAAQAFGEGAQAFDAIDELIAHLNSLEPANVLVKGSRSMRLERVVKEFLSHKMNKNKGEHDAA